MSKEEKIKTINLDIMPLRENERITRMANKDRIYHLYYKVSEDEYKKHKRDKLEEIYKDLEFNRINLPKEIVEADILIIVDKDTNKLNKIIDRLDKKIKEEGDK